MKQATGQLVRRLCGLGRAWPMLLALLTLPPEIGMAGSGAGRPEVSVEADGFLRAGYSSFWPGRFFGVETGGEPGRNPYVGKSDGFLLDGARLNVTAKIGDALRVRLCVDGAVEQSGDPELPGGRLGLGIKDAFAALKLNGGTRVFAGRFKPPFDQEALQPEDARAFVHRSLESRGVPLHEGLSRDAPGFAPGRQLGIMVSNELAAGMAVAVAVTNGNGDGQSLNDNDLPAVWARWELRANGDAQATAAEDDKGLSEGPATARQGSSTSLGLSAFFNQRTVGAPPNRAHDRVVGVGADFGVAIGVAGLRGQVLYAHTTHLEASRGATEDAIGANLQVALWPKRGASGGLTPAYRVSFYDPRLTAAGVGGAASIGASDRIMHHTIGLRYRYPHLPLWAWIEGTISLEEGGRAMSNHRVESVVQVSF